jgi:acetylornithine deacetylase/succinyl-diaminopimelate desuccinylase-like protein
MLPPMTDLQEETTRVLQHLVRANTVNPPGNERAVLEWLGRYLADAGLECELLGPEPERQNLVARLRGDGDGPTLCLLSHVDTVLADPADWSRDPWSGAVADGSVWGRGALDMKSQTAAEAVAAAHLARSGWRPRGELIVVAVADEEAGGEHGAKWLCEQHPDTVRCDFLVNEGAGAVTPFGGRRLYGVCCAEKGTFRFRLITRGRAGHASNPRFGDNALLKLAPLIERLAARTPGYDVPPEAAAFLSALGEEPDDPRSAIERLARVDRRLALLVEPMLGATFAPTQVHASDKINVIPARAEVGVDGRLPPGLGEDVARHRLAEVLGSSDHEVEFTEAVVGNRSPVESPLMDAIGAWLAEADPGGEAVPTMLPAFTDSRTFRDAFPDCVAYGFFPQRHMSMFDIWPLIHGADERIDVRDLGFAASFFADLPQRLLV